MTCPPDEGHSTYVDWFASGESSDPASAERPRTPAAPAAASLWERPATPVDPLASAQAELAELRGDPAAPPASAHPPEATLPAAPEPSSSPPPPPGFVLQQPRAPSPTITATPDALLGTTHYFISEDERELYYVTGNIGESIQEAFNLPNDFISDSLRNRVELHSAHILRKTSTTIWAAQEWDFGYTRGVNNYIIDIPRKLVATFQFRSTNNRDAAFSENANNAAYFVSLCE